MSPSSRNRKSCILELEELRLEAYENFKVYKEKVKCFHDNMILRKVFKVGQKVFLFNSHLKLIAGKRCSKWDGPFVITNVFPYGAVEIRKEATDKTFKVNGNQLKLFHECPTMMEGDMLKSFQNIFTNDIPCGLPPIRGIEHQIDFIMGAILP
ncbi:hypothetical protein CR513_30518, partial [Mucuna pruriens]